MIPSDQPCRSQLFRISPGIPHRFLGRETQFSLSLMRLQLPPRLCLRAPAGSYTSQDLLAIARSKIDEPERTGRLGGFQRTGRRFAAAGLRASAAGRWL